MILRFFRENQDVYSSSMDGRDRGNKIIRNIRARDKGGIQ
jgi:hypothetical protein